MSNYSWSLDQEIPQFWSWQTNIISETFIYFIQQVDYNGYIKIGVSKHPEKRLHELKVGNPDLLYLIGYCRGNRQDEQKLHSLFSANKISGEWFEPCLPLLAMIAELLDNTNN